MATTKRRATARWKLAGSTALLAMAGTVTATGSWAVTFSTMNGAPVQMQPYVDEPGAPMVTVPVGTPQPFASPAVSGGSGGAGGSGSTGGSTEALTTMYGTTWGADAGSNAQSIGLNPSALAMTCVIESSCDVSKSNGSYTGAFQLGAAAFHDGLATALAANPALAPQVVQGPSGINDPTTAAIAAGGYLLQGAQALENAGISNPTALDVRGYYNFTPQIGIRLAQADGGELMSTYLPPSYMTGNAIPGTMTVGQWRENVAAKGGTAAYQPVRAS